MSPKEISKAISHLKSDKNLTRIITALPRVDFKTSGTLDRNITHMDTFEALVRSIIYQQLSGKAAGTILKRFHGLFRGNTPTPEKVLKLKDTQFKEVGVSGQKMSYLRDLSHKFLDGTIDPRHFHEMTDEAIREHLVAVKGIGRWTADMFLMFTLHRPNILPTGDLAIQKGFQKVFKLRSLPDAQKMEKLASVWQPYRTIACLYLWRMQDTGTDSDDW
jgi:DNA-3-methyladenine glycosylase II